MCGAATEVVPTCISSLSLAHNWRKTDVNEFNVRNDDQKFIGNTSMKSENDEDEGSQYHQPVVIFMNTPARLC